MSDHRRWFPACLAAALLFASAPPALAYIGPGAGFALMSSAFVLVTTVLAVFATVLAWPFRALWRLIVLPRKPKASIKRLIVVGLDGQDGRFIRARPIEPPADDAEAPDLGFVGDVESIDTGLIELLLSRDFVPVVMPIGVSADNTTYHINSDRLAGQVARALEAEKLVLMTNIAGILGRDGKLIPILKASDADTLLRERVVHGGMEPRLTAAVRAVREGVRSVHIIDGSVPNALLLEVLTAEGVGTAVRSDAEPNFFAETTAHLLGPA